MIQTKLINKFYDKFNKRVKNYYNLNIDVEFLLNLKGYRVIGQCKKLSKEKYLIRLHPMLLNEYTQIYLDDVLSHEIAHAVQMEIYPKSKPHSKEWKDILSILQETPYKNIKKIEYKKLKILNNNFLFKYKCSCDIHNLSTTRHNRIIKKSHIYRCLKCKGKLVKFN